LRMLQGEPGGDIGSTVVTDDGEARVAERAHDANDVPRHRALRVRSDLGRLAVPAEIGAYDRAMWRQARGDYVPRRVRAGMPVKQDDGRPMASVSNAQGRSCPSVDPFKGESVEERQGCAHPCPCIVELNRGSWSARPNASCRSARVGRAGS